LHRQPLVLTFRVVLFFLRPAHLGPPRLEQFMPAAPPPESPPAPRPMPPDDHLWRLGFGECTARKQRRQQLSALSE
jgi:hypothetical protein